MTPASSDPCSCNPKNAAPCSCAGSGGNPEDIRQTDSTITSANRLDHILARIGVNRMGHIVHPGLYRLGNPDTESPVFASANYTLSFDAVRSALAEVDCYILVLDTKGVNVWCAAGKGTFGTEELIRRIENAGLAGIVSHRKIIVPQLGAPGLSWPDVLRRTGFSLEFGPVRARDLPEYLGTHTATPAMRKVEFPLRDRLILTPIEVRAVALPSLVAVVALFFLAGPLAALAVVAAVLAGTVLFPAFLPVIPTRDFSSRGFIVGFLVAVPFAVLFAAQAMPGWAAILAGLTPLLVMPAVTAYLALNFTGSTTFTSRTGVKKEIFRYVPVMAVMAGAGTLAGVILGVSRLLGVI